MLLEELYHRLFSDLRAIDLPVDEVDIFLRPYSKTYYGRYYPLNAQGAKLKPKIYLYPFERDGSIMSYDTILDTVIHEMCHHIQYTSGHKRRRGVMHDSNFWSLHKMYSDRAKELLKYEALFTKVVYQVG